MPDHEPVPDMHASLEIGRSQDQFIVGRIPDPLIPAPVGNGPVRGLVCTWNGQEQTNIRMIRAEGKHFFRSQRVKTQSSAADKPAGSLLIAPVNGGFQALPDFRHRFPVNLAVAGKTYRILFNPRGFAS